MTLIQQYINLLCNADLANDNQVKVRELRKETSIEKMEELNKLNEKIKQDEKI